MFSVDLSTRERLRAFAGDGELISDGGRSCLDAAGTA
jgi:hypothetical protein